MLKLRAGDKVKFLNAVGGGIVKKIVDNSLVFVEDHDGFEIPVMISELIKTEEKNTDKPELVDSARQEENKKEIENPEDLFNQQDEVIVAGNDQSDTWMALLPIYQGKTFIKQIEVFLINNSNYKILYAASIQDKKLLIHIDAGLLMANEKSSLHTFEYKELSGLMRINIQLIFYKTQKFSPQQPVSCEIVFDPVTIHSSVNYIKSEFFNEKVLLYKIESTDLNKKLSELDALEIAAAMVTKKVPNAPTELKQIQEETEEIDLHIEKITNKYQGLENAEIIEMQLSRFKLALDGAIRNSQQKIVFIHGVGNGKLRYEIRKYIDTQHPRMKYQDASFKEYGYGATLVILR